MQGLNLVVPIANIKRTDMCLIFVFASENMNMLPAGRDALILA
jgi:hypothetical protein